MPGKGHSFWLREDGNSSLGDVPVEPASWLENGFFESHRPGLASVPGPTFPEGTAVCILLEEGLRQPHLPRGPWGQRASLREPDSLSVFVLTNANPSAIHSDRHPGKPWGKHKGCLASDEEQAALLWREDNCLEPFKGLCHALGCGFEGETAFKDLPSPLIPVKSVLLLCFETCKEGLSF